MTALSLYRPRVLENALSGLDRYLDSFFGGNFLNPADRDFDGTFGLNGNSAFRRLPAVNIRETEKAYLLEAELPGYDEKDIEIRLNGNYLTIESKQQTEEKDRENTASEENYLIRERRYSSFTRSFKLPENFDPEGVSASFRNGILSLEIGKKAEAQQKVIQITKS